MGPNRKGGCFPTWKIKHK